ncbi:MAG: GYD domain-containing protein, partial [Actinomycetota bacterium]
SRSRQWAKVGRLRRPPAMGNNHAIRSNGLLPIAHCPLLPRRVYLPTPTSMEVAMAKYLFKASLSPEGAKGVIKDGGSARRAATTKMVESVGGKMEAFYFAFGETDAYLIVDAPDNVAAAAIAMTVSASGSVATETVVLITPEEVDRAVKMKVAFTPPGA